jgi:hypothetical protein
VLARTISIALEPGLAAAITVECHPAWIPAVGGSADVTVTVRDRFENAVADGTVITLGTTLGTLSPEHSSTLAGIAKAVLAGDGVGSGVARVTAACRDATGWAEVLFYANLTAIPLIQKPERSGVAGKH